MTAPSQHTLAIDFGTTNTVFAEADAYGARTLAIAEGTDEHAMRTALAFQRTGRGEPVSDVGPWAISMFLADPENTRFLQSFKSFAASASFSETQIFTRRLGFQHLLEAFLAKSLAHTGITSVPRRIVMGRPVTFAGLAPDEELAMARYEAALKAIGADEVLYVHEPVAAAYFYAQRLSEPATVLVGDFGGGTSDFSLLRFSGQGDVQALGQTGIGIAGDTLDYRILEHVVTPHLGKGGTYTSWGKTLPIPAHYFASFSRWNELCLMNRPAILAELRDFARTSPEARQLESLIAVIEGGESYNLYQAIARTKAELSHAATASFRYKAFGIDIRQTIARPDFNRWIEADVARMLATADALLAQTGQTPDSITRVFLTGGTSFVPAIREAFAQRFGANRIESGDELVSIAKGLALIGTAQDAGRWAVSSPKLIATAT